MAKKSKRVSRGFVAKRQQHQDAPIVAPQTSSWQLFLVNLRLLKRFGAPVVLFNVVPGLLGQLGAALAGTVTLATLDDTTLLGYVIRMVAALMSLFGFAATYYYVLRVLGGKPSGIIESYRRGARFLGRLLLANVSLVIVVAVGLIPFIIPGFVWLRRYFFAPYFLVDENIGVRDAMIASSKATKPVRRHIWMMFGLMLGLTAVAYLGARLVPAYGYGLALVIGMLSVFLPALRYQEMSSDVRAGELAFKSLESDQNLKNRQ